MIVLGCDEVSLSFGGEVVLNGLTFSVNDGDRLGIVGANGAGKTSLLSILLIVPGLTDVLKLIKEYILK